MKFKSAFVMCAFLVSIFLTIYGCGSGSNTIPSRGFTVSGTTLLYRDQPIFLRGIGYSPYRPGEKPVIGIPNGKSIQRIGIPVDVNLGGIQTIDLKNDGRYVDDLSTIKGLNANFVIAYPRNMPPGFFTALDKSGMFYAQCISLNTTFVSGTANDVLDETFQQNSMSAIKSIIDYTYSAGLPDKLVFFSIGDEINAGVIFQTDNAHPNTTSFQGAYITLTNRTPSEVAMAKLIDGAMSYEQQKYHARHLYTHTSWTHIGPVDRPGLEVAKKSLFFADFGDLICMNIYTYARGVVTSQPGSSTGTKFQGYLEGLEAISKKPIIITQTGLSTSPIGVDVPGFGGNSIETTEKSYRQIWTDTRTSSMANRIAGLCWFEYNDEFWKGFTNASVHAVDKPEEWFGIYQTNIDGSLTPKGIIPDIVKELFGQTIL